MEEVKFLQDTRRREKNKSYKFYPEAPGTVNDVFIYLSTMVGGGKLMTFSCCPDLYLLPLLTN